MSAAAIAVLISLVSAAGGIPGVWGIIDGIHKRRTDQKTQADETEVQREKIADENDRMVVKSAVELLQPYREQVSELKTDLRTAKATIDTLTGNLDTANANLASANSKIAELNSQLVDAQTELRFLRMQVKTLSQQLPGEPNPSPRSEGPNHQ